MAIGMTFSWTVVGWCEAQVLDGGDQFGSEAQRNESVRAARCLGCVGRLRVLIGDLEDFVGLGAGGVERLEHGHFGGDSGEFVVVNRLHRRELALRFKSVGHECQISNASAAVGGAPLVVKNINHPTTFSFRF